jgi:hypothetical protein
VRGWEGVTTDPWSGRVETIYWPDNMYESGFFRGVWGTVSSIRKGEGEWEQRLIPNKGR